MTQYYFIKKDGLYLTTEIHHETNDEYDPYSDISELHMTVKRFTKDKDIAKKWVDKYSADVYLTKSRIRGAEVVKEKN